MFAPTLSWYALRTKTSQEKRAADNLKAWNVESFIPWLPAARSRSPRPLFPGYVFARFIEAMTSKIQFTRGVLYVVNFGGVPAAIPDDVIGIMRSRSSETGMVMRDPLLQPGDEVVIRSGPLRDLVGVFERDLPGRERVLILLRAVAYNVRVEIPRFALTALDSNSAA
jgi:transcription antitermination factor NusG